MNKSLISLARVYIYIYILSHNFNRKITKAILTYSFINSS